MYNGIKIIDGHVHPSESFGGGDIAAFFAAHSPMTDAVSLCTVAHSRFLSLTPSALAAKAMHPESTFVFSSLDMSEYYLHSDTLGARMAECGERLIAMGCDGIKMLEGKPQMRKMHPIPDFDAPVWDAFWAWAEEKQVPILMHINDPENFWDAANAPAFAVQQGWLYDESYVNNEAQYAQMLAVLARHPRLCISFAHFFFMSAQLDRLAAILDEYENVRVDLTPGIEMYENFSRDIDAARAFFARYQRRIIYGTDIGGRCVLMGEGRAFDTAENTRRGEIVRCFLAGTEPCTIASDGHFLVNRPAFTLRPLALGADALADILSGNFERFAGAAPRAVDAAAVRRECALLRRETAALRAAVPSFVGDTAQIELAEKFFA